MIWLIKDCQPLVLPTSKAYVACLGAECNVRPGFRSRLCSAVCRRASSRPTREMLAPSAAEKKTAAAATANSARTVPTPGAEAMTRLRQFGGRTIAEAESTAVVWGMPGELVRSGGAEAVVPLDEIAPTLLQMVT